MNSPSFPLIKQLQLELSLRARHVAQWWSTYLAWARPQVGLIPSTGNKAKQKTKTKTKIVWLVHSFTSTYRKSRSKVVLETSSLSIHHMRELDPERKRDWPIQRRWQTCSLTPTPGCLIC
jgi:hypothetical protein